MAEGFDYVLPISSMHPRVLGGRIPKGSGAATSMYNPKNMGGCGANVGPGKYNVRAMVHKITGTIKWKLFGKKTEENAMKKEKESKMTPIDPTAAFERMKPAVKGGLMAKGKRRNFLDSVCKRSAKTPGPANYNQPVETLNPPTMKWYPDRLARIKPKKDSVGPGTYKLNFKPVEDSIPVCKFNKGKAREGGTGKKEKKAAADHGPGPGTYKMVQLEKLSRGMKLMGIHPEIVDKGRTGYY